MRHVLSVIVGPAAAVGLPDLVQRLGRALANAGAAEAGPPVELAAGVAAELEFDGLDRDHALLAARQAVATAPVDLVVQPAAGRRKRLLVADMESTIIRQEMLDELAERIGRRVEVERITARAMAGEIDFAAAVRERVAMLRGLPAGVLDELADRIELMPGALALVRTMRAHGAWTALVSGGFTCFTGRVRSVCGFDEDRANRLEVVDGRLTGRVIEPILDRDAKRATLAERAAALGLTPGDALAVGDGANDVPMLQAAGLGIAFRAKPMVRRAIPACIDHGDLTALLYLQGYHAAEIVGA